MDSIHDKVIITIFKGRMVDRRDEPIAIARIVPTAPAIC
jgi:hypothetical protein